jgi:hypothetical protein
MVSERITVFYSWQSDTPAEVNHTFLEKALLAALERLKTDATLEPALRESTIELDKDTAGVAGSPPITQTILSKIKECAVFVADLTFVGASAKSLNRKNRSPRLLPNPNVLLEYGYALTSRGHERMIGVMNTAYGEPGNENLPFDVRHVVWPICYNLGPAEIENSSTVLADLIGKLVEALKLTLGIHTKMAEERFLPHPQTTDPSSFFTSAEELVSEGVFGRPAVVTSVPKDGRAYLRLYPSRVLPAFESELEARILASRGLRPMGKDYEGWSHSRNAFGGIAYSTPIEGRLYHFTQLFLTRELWGVDAFGLNADRCREFAGGNVKTGFIMSSYVERMFIETLFNYLQFARDFLRLVPPLHVEAGLVGVKDYPIAVDQGFRGKILEDSVTWQSTINSLETPAHALLRPFFERFWKKAGVPRPADYDAILVKYYGPFPS